MDAKSQHEFDLLLLNLLESNLSDQEIERFEFLLFSRPEYLARYCEFVNNYAALQVKFGSEIDLDGAHSAPGESFDMSLWQALAEEERRAEAINILPVADTPELVTGVRERKNKIRSSRQVSRLSLYTALGGLAALFLMIVYVLMNPRPITQPSATIIGSVAARWQDKGFDGKVGTRLYTTDSPLRLLEGLVSVRLDDGAEILIQGPAQFRAEQTNQMMLEYGKLSSVVPPSAQGFVVRTPSATVVDYGTEFGVLVDWAGRTEAHVFKGEVELRCGPDPVRPGGVLRLLSGLAATVTSERQYAGPPRRAEESFFIRDLSGVKPESLSGRQIDLADIVGGGNGFGSGKLHVGIDVCTGKKREGLDSTVDHTQKARQEFTATPDFPFVDSVFIPGFEGRPTHVASTGLTCNTFGTTSWRFWGYIFNGAFHEGAGTDPTPRHLLMLDGLVLEDAAVPVISVHGNMGITFDLRELRRSLPFTTPVRFRARIGLSQTIARYFNRNPWAEFWVLLDGDVRLRRPLRMSDGGLEIEVPLEASSRFLSLAVTEYTDGVSLDWGMFVNPRLELQVRN